MRSYLIRAGIYAIIVSCVPAISKSQTNNTAADKSFTKSNFLDVKVDSLRPPHSSFKQTLFPGVSAKTTLNPVSGFSPRQLYSGMNLPVNTKAPLIKIGKTSLSNQVNNTASSADNMEDYLLNSSTASGGVAVLGVPFSFSYNRNQGWQQDVNKFSTGATKFDKEKFLDQIKEKLKKVANPEELFANELGGLYAKRDQAITSMKNDLAGALQNSNDKLKSEIVSKINAENISRQGIDQFLENILHQSDASLQQSQDKLQLQNASPDSASLLTDEIKDGIKRKEQIAALRDKWHQNGVASMISGFEKEKKSVLDKLMNDPAAIAKVASAKLKLPGFQKLLLNTKSLNIGASGINKGSLTLNNALLKGVSAEFLKGNKYFAPVMGAMPGVKNLTDMFYSNSQQLPSILTGGLTAGKGDPKKDFTHASVFIYQQNNNAQFLPSGFQSALPKNFVATVSKKISLGSSQSLLAEFSKSASLYNGASEGGGMKNLVSRENLFSNMGVNLNYNGDFDAWGLSENLMVRYTGNEYSNLGNYSLVSGSKELSNDLRKTFFKRKLVLTLKAHYREYDFSMDDRKWKSFSYMTDVKWRLPKGEFIEARYQPYLNKRTGEGENYTSSKSYRLALRGNINRKVGKGLTYRNFIELASSRDNFYDFYLDQFNFNRMFSFTSLQTLAIGKQTVFINLTGNQASQRTGYLYSNSSLAVDAGMTFNTTRTLAFSSSLVYNEVDGMYSQVAIRQSVSAMIGKNLVVDGYLNAGKNLYKLDYIKLPAISGNLSISYNLK